MGPSATVDWAAVNPDNLANPALYINRELSWLEFNQRVLAQAQDASHPLLERVKFLGITASNLDEFFMVRVATILKKYRAGIEDISPDGLNTEQQLEAIRARAQVMMAEVSTCWSQSLRPLLDGLPARERQILLLRFYQQKTQSQIAEEIGISQMHVSRLLSRTLEQLRASID